MPKVLRIINRLNLGGPTYNAAYLSKYLAPEFETMLVAGIKEDSEESSEFIIRDLGLEPIYIPEMRREINIWKDRKAYKHIKEIIRKFKPDIVHTHAAKAGAIGRLAARDMKVPIVLHTFHGHVFHSYFSPLKSNFFIRAERYFATLSSGIIAISEIQKKELAETYKICEADKISVIPLGFDLQRFMGNQQEKRIRFRKEYDLKEGEIAIGIVGRLVPIKNHLFFLKVAREILSKVKEVKFFIIGDGENKENLLSHAKDLIPDASRLVFTSWIKEIDIAYAGLDIVALTSLNEGTPVSLIEAQAAGKPVVSTKVGGVENIIIDGESGFLTQTGDIELFTKRLLELIKNETLRKEMGLYGKQSVTEQYHYSNLVERTRNLYLKLLSEK